MGIQDRDYYRERSGRFFDAWGRQGATVWLIVITAVVFFVQCFSTPPVRSPLVEIGAYSYPDVLDGEVWRLLSPVFLHASLFHLFFNMLVLYWAGSRLEDLYGSREFLFFYLLGGVFANSVWFALQTTGVVPAVPPVIGLGASGAVTATLVLFAFHFPWQRVYIWFVLPMPVWAVVVAYVALDGLGAAGVGRGGIGYIVHLGGALFGAIYFQTGVRFGEFFSRPSRARRRVRPQLRVMPAPELEDTPEPVGAAVESQPRPKENGEDLEAKVDAVLEKVSKHGQESLTPEEREILFMASEVYKRRRR
jgi:membrane associated rhomboid family serine protease